MKLWTLDKMAVLSKNVCWLKSHSGPHYVASPSTHKYITHRFLHSWVTHACTELPILLETFEPHRVVKTFRLSLTHTLRAVKLWPLLSLFFQLDRKTGGRKRREGEGGGHNLFGINCTMKSLFSGPTCCSSLSVCVVCECVCKCECVCMYFAAVSNASSGVRLPLSFTSDGCSYCWWWLRADNVSCPACWLSTMRQSQ